MHKNLARITAAIALSAAVLGCSTAPSQPGSSTLAHPGNATPATPDKPQTGGQTIPSAPQGIAFIKIPLVTISLEQAPDGVRRLVEQMKDHPAEKSTIIDGIAYVVITAGEKPSAGYAVNVTSVGDSEGKLEVVYTITKPSGPAASVISYPYTIIKVEDHHGLPVVFRQTAN